MDISFVLDTEIPHCNTGAVVKWYSYDVELRAVNGEWVNVNPANGSTVKLVELACDEAVAVATLEGLIPLAGPFRGLRFTVGVPSELNHQNPAMAAAPLNRSDMFWVWRQGYKFLSIEAKDNVLHVGSTGCEGPAPVRPPTQVCKQSNRLTVTLDAFNPETDVVSLNLGDLLAITAGQRCTGNYGATGACREALGLLGLDTATGRCDTNCGRNLFGRARQ